MEDFPVSSAVLAAAMEPLTECVATSGTSKMSEPSTSMVSNAAERDLEECFANVRETAERDLEECSVNVTETSTMSEPSTMRVVSAAERDLEEGDLEERVADPTETSTSGSSGTSTEATIVEVQSPHPKKKWRFVWIVQDEPMTPVRRVPAFSPLQYTPSLAGSSTPPSTRRRSRSPLSHRSSLSATTLERGSPLHELDE